MAISFCRFVCWTFPCTSFIFTCKTQDIVQKSVFSKIWPIPSEDLYAGLFAVQLSFSHARHRILHRNHCCLLYHTMVHEPDFTCNEDCYLVCRTMAVTIAFTKSLKSLYNDIWLYLITFETARLLSLHLFSCTKCSRPWQCEWFDLVWPSSAESTPIHWLKLCEIGQIRSYCTLA